jgi:hypothetical protein
MTEYTQRGFRIYEFSGGHGVRRSQALLLAEFKVKDAVLRARREGACGRLLVGQGEATWDPSCALPVGHEGLCRP